MMGTAETAELIGRAGALRQAFDRSFAAPARSAPAELDDLLTIRLAGNPYALRMDEITGLLVDQPVTALPSRHRELLGLVGVRGSLVAVYDLAALLGDAETGVPRWMVLAARHEAIAFAFHDLDGHVRVPARALVSDPRGHREAGEVVAVAGVTRTLICIPDLIAALRPAESHKDPAESHKDSDRDNAGKERP